MPESVASENLAGTQPSASRKGSSLTPIEFSAASSSMPITSAGVRPRTGSAESPPARPMLSRSTRYSSLNESVIRSVTMSSTPFASSPRTRPPEAAAAAGGRTARVSSWRRHANEPSADVECLSISTMSSSANPLRVSSSGASSRAISTELGESSSANGAVSSTSIRIVASESAPPAVPPPPPRPSWRAPTRESMRQPPRTPRRLYRGLGWESCLRIRIISSSVRREPELVASIAIRAKRSYAYRACDVDKFST